MQFKLRVVGHVDEIHKGEKHPDLSRDPHLLSEMETLLNTPITELRKPLAVHSQILGEVIYLVSDQEMANEVEAEAKVAYLPEEIAALSKASKTRDLEEWVGYLKSLHSVKKTFMGSRIIQA